MHIPRDHNDILHSIINVDVNFFSEEDMPPKFTEVFEDTVSIVYDTILGT